MHDMIPMALDLIVLIGTPVAALIAMRLFDPETLELYLGNRTLLVATSGVLAATVAVLLLVDLVNIPGAGSLALGRSLPFRL